MTLDPRTHLLLHGLGLVVVAFLGYFHVLAGEVCAALVVGLVLPSPVSPARTLFTSKLTPPDGEEK